MLCKLSTISITSQGHMGLATRQVRQQVWLRVEINSNQPNQNQPKHLHIFGIFRIFQFLQPAFFLVGESFR